MSRKELQKRFIDEFKEKLNINNKSLDENTKKLMLKFIEHTYNNGISLDDLKYYNDSLPAGHKLKDLRDVDAFNNYGEDFNFFVNNKMPPKGRKAKNTKQPKIVEVVDDEIDYNQLRKDKAWKEWTQDQRNAYLKFKRDASREASYGFMDYKPSTDRFDPEEEERVFKKSNRWLFDNPNHPYWNTRTEYNAKMENPYYAAYYANKVGGKAYRGDFNDDGVDDVIVTDKLGNLKYVNGQSRHKSNRGKDLLFYDSPEYAELSHKTEKGSLDVLSRKAKSKWFKDNKESKKDADVVLRKAGFTTFKAKEKTLNNILKESCGDLYKNVIDVIVEQNKLDAEAKKKLKQHVSKSRLENLIVNAILLKIAKTDLSNIKPSTLENRIAILKKVWNKDKDMKQAVIDHANTAVDSLNTDEALIELAGPLYKIAQSNQNLSVQYKAIIDLLKTSIEIAKETEDFYDDQYKTAFNEYNEARKVASKAYREKHPKPKKSKK